MISSFFGKTKPANYIVLLITVFVCYCFVHFFLFDKHYGPEYFILQLVTLATLCFGYFVMNFIVKRNKVTGPNSYTILFFTLFLLVFPKTLIDSNAIYCSFFLLLALRRLISLHSLKAIRSKLFDATLWIVIASLFYDWALLFLCLVYLATYVYEPKNIKNWLVPFAGVFAAGMVIYCVLTVFGWVDFVWEHYVFDYRFNKANFLNWATSTKLVLYIAAVSIVGLLSFVKLGKAGMGKVATMRLVAVAFVLGVLLNFLVSGAEVYPIMVTFFPASIFFAKYVESIRRANMKEVTLMLSIFLPLMVFFLSLAIGD
ncbi:DUF6427 family protein [Maribacter sp. 2-571]|uniref:DUF6427 family protein n=1 Tax=Maribacter sp. 2-571 TaxID=3417569 RepID=UPI003D34BAD8